MRAAEEKDNPLAKNTIAMFYDLGWGRPTDPVKACQWYEQAAQDDIPVAADALGRCLEQGIHRKPDPAQAAVWYQKAADLGLHYALCHLGDLYISGLGVDGDPARGLALCQKSAEQGSVPAMLRLADYYQTEDGISNDESALHWLSAAAGYQSAEAEFQLGVVLRDGRGIDRDPIVKQQTSTFTHRPIPKPACGTKTIWPRPTCGCRPRCKKPKTWNNGNTRAR